MLNTQDECIEFIHSLSKFGKKDGLSNTLKILKRLGDPQKKLKFIHIGGTNGKGSTSNMINNILLQCKYKVGYYTSPYIEYFNERICINNEMIPPSDLTEYTNRVKDVLGEITPLEFEFITCMAMLYFYEKKCDIVVLEVGLGGRLDATNVINTPLLNVITPIGYDHMSILGDTLPKIAYEKACIIKEKSNVVISPDMEEECIDVIKKRCLDTSSSLIIPKGKAEDVCYGKKYTSFNYKGIKYELSLKGKYQIGNAITAIESALALSDSLNIKKEDISKGLKNSFWKCRFEIFEKDVDFVLDGAHNSHGIRALMESVEIYFKNKKRVFVFSMLNEKDYEKSIKEIVLHSDYIIVTSVPSLRQRDPVEIYEEVRKNTDNCEYISDSLEALKKGCEIAKKTESALFVFGSLYLTGNLRKYVK